MQYNPLYPLTQFRYYRCHTWLFRRGDAVYAHPAWLNEAERLPESSPFVVKFADFQYTCFNMQCTVHVQKNFLTKLPVTSVHVPEKERLKLRKAFYTGKDLMKFFFIYMGEGQC